MQLTGQAPGLQVLWTPGDNLNCDTCLNPTLKVVEPGWYVLQALDTTGCVGKDSAYVDIFYPLYLPNAFTPNNDGVNDVFKAEGVNIRGYQMHIYNRWGQLIFTSDDPQEPWLGNVQGGDHYAPDGLYMWKVRFDNWDGPRWLEGHVTLFR